MGRDWSWLGGGGKKKPKKDTKPPPSPPPQPSSSPAGNSNTAAGCMSAVFNIFDLHHLQFPINHHHLHLPKGVDAPRNSLESREEEQEETPFSPPRKDGNLNISMGIKIKTKPPQGRSSTSSLTPTESYSPSVKTPTLVARLMGLDLVPDNERLSSSPTPSSSSSCLLKTPTRTSHANKHRHYYLQRNSVDGGTRSLPETPRISLGRRSVDVNCYEHQRSSLHRRDNNINVSSERDSGINNVRTTRVKEMKIHEDKENRSPREYARQIVMQLKENVNRRRRMGTDITNKEQQPREVHDSKKASKMTIITHDSSTLSSPRLSLTEILRTKPTSSPNTNNVASKITDTTVKLQDKKLPTVQVEPQRPKQQHRKEEEKAPKQRKSTKKCKKPENFKSRLVKPPQTMQEEPFIRSPAKTTTSNTKSSSNTNSLLLLQGDKNTPLSINNLINFTAIKNKASSPHKSSNIHVDTIPRNRASASSELEYITRTLRRTGIDKDTPISYAKWFSPSHPLDPSIFYFLEHFAFTSNPPQNLSLRCNRKLLFHLTDEILSDILKPHINLKPWLCNYSIHSRRNLRGAELINELAQRIKRFPSAECLVLEDIDALVAGDFPETTSEFEEEGECIVTEIEREILETLVTETTTDCYDTWSRTAPFRSNDDVSGTWGVHVRGYSLKNGTHHDPCSLFRDRNPRG